MRKTDKHIEMADILGAGMDAYRAKYGSLTDEYYRVINTIIACRTSVMGAHVNRCDNQGCGYEKTAYNSCRNRHCPKCQGKVAAEWVEARVQELLPVPYFHTVFTLPHELNPVALRNKKEVYNLFFKSVSETLTELAHNRKRLGAEIGFFCILHTWSQSILDHIHIHCVVPGGGLAKNRDRWKKTRRHYLFPVKVMGKLFRGKFLAYFKEAVRVNKIQFHGKTEYLKQSKSCQDFMRMLYKKEWVVYSKPPFAGPGQAVKYLSRYTHRIAISNRRIFGMQNGKVSFKWKDYKDQNKWKDMKLDIAEFIRRFLLHFLPSGFVRIRYFGLMANRCRKKSLEICRRLLEKISQSSVGEISHAVWKYEAMLCPKCKKGHLVISCSRPIFSSG